MKRLYPMEMSFVVMRATATFLTKKTALKQNMIMDFPLKLDTFQEMVTPCSGGLDIVFQVMMI